MRTLIVPVSYTGVANRASERIRCDWLLGPLGADKFDGSQQVQDYDLLICQKVLPAQLPRIKDQVRIWDTTDPMWRFNDHSEILRGLQTIDVTTCSCEELVKDFHKRFPDRRCELIPDGHDFGYYRPFSKDGISESADPVFVWFGYAETFGRAKSLCQEIVNGGHRLVTISEKPVGVGEFKEWLPDTWLLDIAGCDISINPLDPKRFKSSNHKHVTSWALGLPVAETMDEARSLLDPGFRIKSLASKSLDQYDVRHSARMVGRLYEEIASSQESTGSCDDKEGTRVLGSAWRHDRQSVRW